MKPEVAVVVIEAQVVFAVSSLACSRLNSVFSKLFLLITFLSKLFGLEVKLNLDRRYSELE